jgi:hypothetical protein
MIGTLSIHDVSLSTVQIVSNSPNTMRSGADLEFPEPLNDTNVLASFKRKILSAGNKRATAIIFSEKICLEPTLSVWL